MGRRGGGKDGAFDMGDLLHLFVLQKFQGKKKKKKKKGQSPITGGGEEERRTGT